MFFAQMKGFSRGLANCPQDSSPRRCGAVALFKSSSPQDQTKSPEPKFEAFRLVRMKGFEPTLF